MPLARDSRAEVPRALPLDSRVTLARLGLPSLNVGARLDNISLYSGLVPKRWSNLNGALSRWGAVERVPSLLRHARRGAAAAGLARRGDRRGRDRRRRAGGRGPDGRGDDLGRPPSALGALRRGRGGALISAGRAPPAAGCHRRRRPDRLRRITGAGRRRGGSDPLRRTTGRARSASSERRGSRLCSSSTTRTLRAGAPRSTDVRSRSSPRTSWCARYAGPLAGMSWRWPTIHPRSVGGSG